MKRFFKENALNMLLSAAVLSGGAYIYSCGDAGTAAVFTVFGCLYTLVLTAFFTFMKSLSEKKSLLMRVLVVVLVPVTWLVSMMYGLGLCWQSGSGASWFLEPAKFDRIYAENIAGVIISFGYIMVASVFYFTRIRYRRLFVFLICMCPFALFAKTFTDIPVIYPIAVTTFYFLLMIMNSTGEQANKTKGYYTAAAALLLTVTVIASFFPKIDYAPYRTQFDELITGVNIGAAGLADFTDFSTGSSVGSSDDETLVFEIEGDNPVLIKRQCFNYFDGGSDEWEYYGDYNTGMSGWAGQLSYTDPSTLYAAAGYDGEKPETGKCRIRSARNRIRAIYTPENMTVLDAGYYNDMIYRTELDEYFITNSSSSFPGAYNIEWAVFTPDTGFIRAFSDYVVYNNTDDQAVYQYARAKAEAKKYDSYLLDEEQRRQCFSNQSAWHKAHELTLELIAGADTDYEKALAIEAYFRGDDYVYDIDYTSPNASPDYFIFTSKRGTCTSYATAMTLLCREAGLTARYVEGFWIQKFDEEKKNWYATAADSHAYVQVWLDGYGWTDFNPVSSNTDEPAADYTFLVVGAAAALIAVTGFMIIFLRPRVEEAAFVRSLKRMRGRKQAIAIYNRLNRLLNVYAGNKKNTLTPTQTQALCMELIGFDAGTFISDYERMAYGGDDPPGADNSAVYSGFAAALREAKKRKGKK